MTGDAKPIYFPALDGLRFCAFLLVFFHHLAPNDNAVLAFVNTYGWVGVHVFLFLSAYLLTVLLQSEHAARGRISIGHFFVRRTLRIWPLYLAFSGAMIAWTIYEYGYNPGLRPHIVGLGVFADNWVTGVFDYSPIPYTSHLWTISLEEQFYLILPWLLAWWLASRRRHMLSIGVLVLWLLFVAIRALAVTKHLNHPWIWTSLFSADSLLLGTWLGARRTSVTDPRLRAACLVAGVIGLASPGLLPGIEVTGWHQLPLYAFVALGAALLCIASVTPGRLNVLATGPIRYLGKISYGLYVFHLFAMFVTDRILQETIGGTESWALRAVVTLAATIAMAAASYALLEKPFLRMKRRFETVPSRPL